ncbi:MAG: glycosyltransferase family 2 protein [Petrotogales bacterium]
MNDNKFKVVIPVYNSENWIEKCIRSLYNQSYENWECVIIDDCSTDETLEKIKKFMLDIPKEEQHKKRRFRVLQRTENVGALENIVYGTKLICDNPEDIIVLLDGDDWLASHDVLEHLNGVYQNDNVWLTYGSYSDLSNGKKGIGKLIEFHTQRYRKEFPWFTSHLRTFKYKIWTKVKDNDLRGLDGKYFAMAWDLAIMYPMIEMAGNNRIRYVDKILYIYNNQNPIGDSKKNVNLQLSTARYIKSLQQYKEI